MNFFTVPGKAVVKSKPYHRKLYQYIVEELGQRIVKGRYGGSEGLPTEDQLCSELDVSRGVLREATKVLVQKGLIRTRPRVGTQVLPRDSWNLFDPDVLLWRLRVEDKSIFLRTVTEVRRIIESEAARLAALRASDDEVANLKSILDRMVRILGDDVHYEYEQYLDIDIAFHTSILKACHNDLLSQIGSTMREAVHQAREHDVNDIDIQKESLPFHVAIVDGIARKDPEAAYRASQQMFDDVWRYIEKG
jgi:DNA-binding FadR family transcriptional regulator